eukprot:CAMPEP_0172454670 /NCGR_PEP_ID=MMETSP1065-20121228/11585_1 /TAXON_ID=265537 /ORGANISM="Amphiprora paludosa, Strain CCMP125" /LENGTH=311 /DNA_ID=CAMNT_0013207035 /DNA_START=87 /DNA_END=1022 /DNA_ORIENTATION=+
MANKIFRSSPIVRPKRKVTRETLLGSTESSEQTQRSRLPKFLVPNLTSISDNSHDSSSSSLSFFELSGEDDALGSSPRSPVRLPRMLSVRRNSLEKEIQPKRARKLVRFEEPSRLATVMEKPPMSEEEHVDSFWSKDELKEMAAAAQRLAEEAAWKKDRNILLCLQLCYGFSPDPFLQSTKKDYSWLTTEKAVNFYYSFKIKDETDTKTVLRGLERQISSEIEDYRMQSIQTVLSLQAKIRESTIKAKDKWTTQQAQNALCKQSMELSTRARRFARLMGKADAAVLGNKPTTTNSNNGKQRPVTKRRECTV